MDHRKARRNRRAREQDHKRQDPPDQEYSPNSSPSGAEAIRPSHGFEIINLISDDDEDQAMDGSDAEYHDRQQEAAARLQREQGRQDLAEFEEELLRSYRRQTLQERIQQLLADRAAVLEGRLLLEPPQRPTVDPLAVVDENPTVDVFFEDNENNPDPLPQPDEEDADPDEPLDDDPVHCESESNHARALNKTRVQDHFHVFLEPNVEKRARLQMLIANGNLPPPQRTLDEESTFEILDRTVSSAVYQKVLDEAEVTKVVRIICSCALRLSVLGRTCALL